MRRGLIGLAMGMGLGVLGLAEEARSGFLFVVGEGTEIRELYTHEAVQQVRDSLRAEGYVLEENDNLEKVTDSLALTNYNSIFAGKALRDTNFVLDCVNPGNPIFLPDTLKRIIPYVFQPLISSDEILEEIKKTGLGEHNYLIYDTHPPLM